MKNAKQELKELILSLTEEEVAEALRLLPQICKEHGISLPVKRSCERA